MWKNRHMSEIERILGEHHLISSLQGPEVIKLFSYSNQLSTKFQLLIKTKIQTNKEVPCFIFLGSCIYHANECSLKLYLSC